MKIVLIVLVLLALLYGLSFVFSNQAKPKDPKAYLNSVGSGLGDGIKSLADRLGPGFDFKTVSDPHVAAKTRTITVPHGQTVNIRINPGSGMQRLTFTQIAPACK